MSLRDRLTLLNLLLLGGLFVFFGVIAYVFVTVLLYNQIDNSLQTSSDQLIKQIQVDNLGHIRISLAPIQKLNPNIYVQVWEGGKLLASSSGFDDDQHPFDPLGLRATLPVFRDVNFEQTLHLRVLNIPLVSSNRRIGLLQIATGLSVVDSARRNLLSVLVFSTVFGVSIAAVASRWTVYQALTPLEVVTEAADQINRADNLARRVPYDGPPDDEIGQLVNSFNQTLERLEVLFTSQQRFIADVSHELRTPLTVIKGNVDLMRRMKDFDAESLDSIDAEANRLTRLVTDLLLLAKAEAGQIPLTKTMVELDNLLMEVFGEMRVLAASKVRVRVTEIDQLQVNGDRDRLKQVLLNLVANAINYTPAGGDVFLSLSRSGDYARIIVRDTGPGIPADALPYIFERFYRAEKSRTRSGTSGFGLGLSIAHWIVEQHGGRIEVNSQEGKGTTFAVWLPLVG